MKDLRLGMMKNLIKKSKKTKKNRLSFCLLDFSPVLQFKQTSSFAVLIFLSLFVTHLQNAREDTSADESRINYEMGFYYLLKNDKENGRLFLTRALEGQFSDLARLELLRLTASEKRKVGETRLPLIKNYLQEFQDEIVRDRAWIAAIQSLIEGQEVGGALELALEMPLRFPESPLAPRALLISSQIFRQEKNFAAALERLYLILDQYPESPWADDACYGLLLVYLSPGEYYNSMKAMQIIDQFEAFLNKPAYATSIRRTEIARLRFDLQRKLKPHLAVSHYE